MNRPEITVQMANYTLRSIAQMVEPEAAHLLVEMGGQVTHYALHNLFYWEEFPSEEQSQLSWPPGTFSIYVSPRGQEDIPAIFAVFLLPGSPQEFHLIYDYRPGTFSRSFEEYFTLRLAQAQETIFS